MRRVLHNDGPNKNRVLRRSVALAVATATAVIPSMFAGHASAAPVHSDPIAAARPSADGSKLVKADLLAGEQVMLVVHSAAMDKDITMRVLRPTKHSGPSPTLYLLSGVEGSTDTSGWLGNTDVVNYFADKNVNIVIPYGGASSYYTDWKRDDPKLGRNMWQTFLTKELPPVIDSALDTTGKNAIAGMSMSGTSALNLPISAPGLYQAAGSYSGCAMTSDPLGQAFVASTVTDFFGDPLNMWGPPGDPAWAANDPLVNAEKLRGVALYISNGSGLPGAHDTLDSQWVKGDLKTYGDIIVKGGLLEAATDICTRRMAGRLADLHIPATVNFRPGTHMWGYWQDDLHDSWPIFAKALGV